MHGCRESHSAGPETARIHAHPNVYSENVTWPLPPAAVTVEMSLFADPFSVGLHDVIALFSKMSKYVIIL